MRTFDDPSTTINFLVPVSLKRELKTVAAEAGCTVTDVIRVACKQFMQSTARDSALRREKGQKRAA
jgi:antitoxin component of RelBE/YafQ-DinJ toxin-antitoxin module